MFIQKLYGLAYVRSCVETDQEDEDGPEGGEEEAGPEEGFWDNEGSCAQEQVDTDESCVVFGFIDFVDDVVPHCKSIDSNDKSNNRFLGK